MKNIFVIGGTLILAGIGLSAVSAALSLGSKIVIIGGIICLIVGFGKEEDVKLLGKDSCECSS
jgi:hypothetical protein